MDYDVEARADAIEMLAPIAQGGSGQVVTLSTAVAGTFNPATQTTSGGSTLTETGSGVEVAYTSHQVDGTLIKVGDKSFLLSPVQTDGAALTAPVPDKTTLTLADGSAWLVKRVETLAPAGLVVMFTLQLRKN